ncbi:hypothetical protein J6590_087399 [Homalodisca vitripennis]|nr:hypothetical protein J6590_087399 [Homalodisca vitripennis]
MAPRCATTGLRHPAAFRIGAEINASGPALGVASHRVGRAFRSVYQPYLGQCTQIHNRSARNNSARSRMSEKHKRLRVRIQNKGVYLSYIKPVLLTREREDEHSAYIVLHVYTTKHSSHITPLASPSSGYEMCYSNKQQGKVRRVKIPLANLHLASPKPIQNTVGRHPRGNLRCTI